jgi:uncharacterized C2H2 Zn-finger protein
MCAATNLIAPITSMRSNVCLALSLLVGLVAAEKAASVTCAVNAHHWGTASACQCADGQYAPAGNTSCSCFSCTDSHFQHCPKATQLENCNTQPCPVDCVITDWLSVINDCSQTCGGGEQARNRSIIIEAANGGNKCGARQQTRACKTSPGMQYRKRSVDVAALHGGKPCAEMKQARGRLCLCCLMQVCVIIGAACAFVEHFIFCSEFPACPHCAAAFGTAGTMTAHCRDHAPSYSNAAFGPQRKDHACPQCPQCDAAFGRASNLTTHVRVVHEQRKDHACPQCDAAFGRASDPMTHVRTVHEQR